MHQSSDDIDRSKLPFLTKSIFYLYPYLYNDNIQTVRKTLLTQELYSRWAAYNNLPFLNHFQSHRILIQKIKREIDVFE